MQSMKFFQSLRFRLILMSILVIAAGGALRDQLGMNVVRNGEQELVSSQQLSLAQ